MVVYRRIFLKVVLAGLTLLMLGSLAVAQVTPSVQVIDQRIVNGRVIITNVTNDGPGWIVIHADADGSPGPVIGYTAVEVGSNSFVIVEIDEANATDVLYAMLHTDVGEVGTFEFPGPDVPVTVAGAVVTPSFSVAGSVSMADGKAMADKDDGMTDGKAMADKDDGMTDGKAMADKSDGMADGETMADKSDGMTDGKAMADKSDGMADNETMADEGDSLADGEAMAVPVMAPTPTPKPLPVLPPTGDGLNLGLSLALILGGSLLLLGSGVYAYRNR